MLDTLTAYVSRQRRKQLIHQQLSAYSDRELDDMGIRRDDIARIAARAARR